MGLIKQCSGRDTAGFGVHRNDHKDILLHILQSCLPGTNQPAVRQKKNPKNPQTKKQQEQKNYCFPIGIPLMYNILCTFVHEEVRRQSKNAQQGKW